MSKNSSFMFCHRFAVTLICLAVASMFAVNVFAIENDSKTENPSRSQYQMTDTSWFYYFATQLQSNPYLSRDLELADFQQQQLKELKEQMQQQYNEMMSEYRLAYTNGNYQQAQAEYMKKLNSYKESYADRLKDLLLPHQVQRLEQIVRQQKSLYSRGSGSSYYYGRRDELDLPVLLAEELDLSDKELEKVKKVVEESRKEMEEEARRIKEKAVKEVLDALPSRKRRKFSELIGKPYDFAAAQREVSESFLERARKQRESEAEQSNSREESDKDRGKD